MSFPNAPVGSRSDAFSGRPNISLRLNVSEAVVSGTNRSTISWSLQLVETTSQPSYNLNATSTASLSFTLGTGVSLYSGDNTPSIAKYSYDFRATGNQTKTIGSGSFVVTHNDAGGGAITAAATATDVGGNLGSASIPGNAASVWTLIDVDTTPNTPAVPTITQYGNGLFGVGLVNPGTANGGPATSVYYQIYDATTGTWDFTNRAAGNIQLTRDHQYIFRAVAINNQATEYSGNTGQYAGTPSPPTITAVTESSSQSRDVTVSWAIPANNGLGITSQIVYWATDPGITQNVFSQTFNDATTSSYTILNNRSTGNLNPSTTYYYYVQAYNGAGWNGSSVVGSTTRQSSPRVSTSTNGAPTNLSTLKVHNGSGFVPAQTKVFNGTSWVYLK